MYAIVQTSGKQYRVEEGCTITVDRVNIEEGKTITLDQVLLWVVMALKWEAQP